MNAAAQCADDANRLAGTGGHEGTGGTGSLGGTGGVAVVCSSPAQCDDKDKEPCTVPTCTDGHCVEVPSDSATPTDDGNPCTDDACTNGVSTHTNNTADCQNGPSCTNAAAKAQDKCDGAGNCLPGKITSCATYACEADQPKCKTMCSGDGDCTDAYCEGQVCKAKRVPGEPCSDAKVCSTGFCTDGVCCNSACGAPCNSCNLGGGTSGLCSPLPKGVMDTCPGQNGKDVCNGGICVSLTGLKAVGEPCTLSADCFAYTGVGDPAGCISGLCRLAVGAACVPDKPHECATNLCDAAARTCKECTAAADCPNNIGCDIGSHRCYLGAGSVCGTVADCTPGHTCNNNNVCQ